MNKNDLIKTESGIFRILSIEKENVLAIDCEKKTMPRFFPISFFENGEIIKNLTSDFSEWEELSLNEHRIIQKRYTMIASALAVVSDKKKRNMMIDIASKQFDVSKQTIRSLLCSYLVYQNIAVLLPQKKKQKELTKDQKKNKVTIEEDGEEAIKTAYTPIQKLNQKYTYLEVELITGKTHQIRAH